MKKLLFLVLLCKVSTIVLAQQPSLEQVLKAFETPGTKITYVLKMDKERPKNALIITIKETKEGLAFDYETLDEDPNKGTLKMSKEAMKNARKINPSLDGEELSLVDETVFFLSDDVYNLLAQGKEERLSVNEEQYTFLNNSFKPVTEAEGNSSESTSIEDEEVAALLAELEVLSEKPSSQGFNYNGVWVNLDIMNLSAKEEYYNLFILDAKDRKGSLHPMMTISAKGYSLYIYDIIGPK